MKALQLFEAGGTENLKLTNITSPTPQAHEILVETKAISVNPVDFKVRANDAILSMINGPERPIIIGWDIAGIVREVGEEVSKFKVGDAVFGMVNFPGTGNAYAELVAAPADQMAAIPSGISFEDAAASTLAALTALQALEGRVKKGDKVLIHAGSGGVGHFAIQIAKSMGAHVITTSSGRNKEFVMSLGADAHIDYRTQKFEEELSDIDFVLDMFNGEILLNSIKVTRQGGTIISLPTPDFSDEVREHAKEKMISVSQIMVQSNGNDMDKIATLMANKDLKPFVSETYHFAEMGKAHLQLESGRTIGKVVVTV